VRRFLYGIACWSRGSTAHPCQPDRQRLFASPLRMKDTTTHATQIACSADAESIAYQLTHFVSLYSSKPPLTNGWIAGMRFLRSLEVIFER
jgi:hypothetical protein